MLRWEICERKVSAHEYYVGVVKDKQTGRMVLCSTLGGVTIQDLNMICGSLYLIYRVQKT